MAREREIAATNDAMPECPDHDGVPVGVTMTPEQFVAKIKTGEVQVLTGARDGDNIISLIRTLTLDDDVDGITAEAFNQGVFDAVTTSWEEARAEIDRLIRVRLMREERRS